MKIFNNVRNFIGEDNFKIYIYKDKIDIINFDKIDDITNNKVIVIKNQKIIIEGKNLKVNKIFSNELLITGNIGKVIFNE